MESAYTTGLSDKKIINIIVYLSHKPAKPMRVEVDNFSSGLRNGQCLIDIGLEIFNFLSGLSIGRCQLTLS